MPIGKKSIRSVAPYQAGKPIEEAMREYGLSHVVKLASNENPYGCSPKAADAAKSAAAALALYPDGGVYGLRHALAQFHGLHPAQFVFGTGSDGLIELICKTFVSEGDECIIPSPSFSLYESNVLAAGGRPVVVGLRPEGVLNLEAMAKAITPATKVIWLCNPNNPTGGIYTQQEQEALLRVVGEDILVVLDEAYYEFAADEPDYPDSREALVRYPNLIILRTFSKVYGLAGLRVGYAMAREETVQEMERVRAPFNVNSVAQAAAVAALGDQDFVRRTLEQNAENRAYLVRELSGMGITCLESHTNFVMAHIGRPAGPVYEALLRRGYIVKGGHVLGMEGYLRITVGTHAECEGFLQALRESLEEI